MQTNFKIDPAFSIIYHDENRVEFRSGVWNITSHCLNDDCKNNVLAKIILEIDENGFDNVSSLSRKTSIAVKECDKVIDILQKKKLFFTEQPASLKKHPKKIVLLDDQDVSKALLYFLKNKFPAIKIENISREELFFIEQHGEAVFRDNLVLEKIIEQCKILFSGSLVITITKSIDPVFYLFLNKVLHESNIAWFFTAIDGPFVYVGPLFNQIFCFECLDHRVLMNTRQSMDYLQYKKAAMAKKIKRAVPEVENDVIHFASSLASMEISHYLTTGRCIAKQKMLSVFMPTMEFAYHKILRLPGCRVCGVDNALHGHQLHFDMGALISQ
jgi:bacteriocin biosynthesis cyclodehydratase domain-containing protein